MVMSSDWTVDFSSTRVRSANRAMEIHGHRTPSSIKIWAPLPFTGFAMMWVEPPRRSCVSGFRKPWRAGYTRATDMV